MVQVKRHICAALQFNRKSIRYQSKRNPFNEALLLRIKELCAARVRYGQRRIHVLLQREGWSVNHKRVAHLSSQEVRQI